MEKHKIFISSVQKEFKEERRALRDYIHGDPLLRQFFEKRRGTEADVTGATRNRLVR